MWLGERGASVQQDLQDLVIVLVGSQDQGGDVGSVLDNTSKGRQQKIQKKSIFFIVYQQSIPKNPSIHVNLSMKLLANFVIGVCSFLFL